MSKFLKLSLILLLVATTSQAAVFKVKEGGAPPYFTNLDTALFTASTYGPGPHQIEVYAGTYNTDIDLVVPTNVDAITGMEAGVNFVHPSPPTWISLSDNFLDVAGTSGLTISGLNVSGYNGGIVTKGALATDLTVQDCIFEDNIVAIYVGSNGGIFNDIEVIGGWMGIGINSLNSFGGEAINNNLIQSCTIHGVLRAPAIAIDADENFFDPTPGNAAASINNNQILGCTIYECSDQAIMVDGATNTMIDGCEIYDVQFAGIGVWGGASGGTFSNNKIHQVAQGSINPDSTLLTWSGLGAVSVHDGDNLIIEFNTIYDNGGLGTMGDAVAFADYAVGLAAASTGNRVRDNCFFGHDGNQGLDDEIGGSNVWRRNFYPDLAATTYLVDGTAGEVDTDPQTFHANANTAAATYEVWDVFDMTFDWVGPNCDPIDESRGLASYNFTVTYDPTKLQYVGGSGGYNEDFLGDTAIYAPITTAPGQVTFGGANFLAPGIGDANLAFGQFEVIGYGPVTVTLNSTYLDGNNVPIIVKNTALNLTLTDTQAPTIDVTANNPVGDNTYSDHVDLEITGNVTDNFALYRVWYAFDGSGSWNFIQNVTGTSDTYGPYTVDLSSLGVGAHVLNMRVRDQAGNYAYVDYNFSIDRSAPALTSITMSDADGCALDQEYTNDPTVDVALVDDGTATEMQWSLGPGNMEGFIPYANPTTYTLTNADGAYQLYVQLRDAYGNTSSWIFDWITLDMTAPNPTAAWLVSDPTPATTGTASIVADANWDVAGGTAKYALSEDPNDMLCAGTVWTAAPPSPRPIPFTLSAGDGTKTVYFGSRDLAGNIAYVTQSIILDTTPPEFLTFDLPECVNTTTGIQASFTWDGTAYPDVKYIRFGTSSPPGGALKDITAEDPNDAHATFNLGGAGDYTIYAVLYDETGNVSAEVSDDITVDLTTPSTGTMRMNGNVSWTNSATVDVLLSGAFSTDITDIQLSQTSGDYSLPENDWQPYVGNPGIQFTFDPVTEDVVSYLYARVRDCAGNISTEAVDGIRFDLTDPVLTSVEINSGAANTNSATVNVDIVYTELHPNKLYISEASDMTGAVEYAWAGTGSYVFTLSSGDAVKTLYVQFNDLAGNESTIESDDILLDTQAPTGTFELVQTSNPNAASGYTNNLTVDVLNISHDGDVAQMRFRNSDGTNITAWMAPVASIANWSLTGAGGEGTKTVEMKLVDLAGNYSGWLPVSIEYDVTLPAPVTGFTVTPSGSLDLNWTAGPDDQYYIFRYNASFEYPTFASGVPPAPTWSEGFFGAVVTGTTYHFDEDDYPDMDLFTFSLWTVDKAGNMSPAYATASGSNYIPGDFDWNGTVEFVEFGDIAAAYQTVPNTKPTADIAVTVAEDPLSVPAPPDGLVSFPDLNKFAQNYAGFGDFGAPAPKGISPIAISAEYPGYLPQGAEYTFSLKVDNPTNILAYRVVLDIDESKFDIVSVEPGAMYEDGMPAFFYRNENSTDIEIDGAVFGTKFHGDEIAVVTVRARNAGEFELKESELIAQGAGNTSIDVSFSGVAKEGLVPLAYSLHQNYPNPFNPTTTISFDLPVASQYDLTIYNVAGQAIKTYSAFADPGTVVIEWNAEDVASGVYFYRIVAGDFTAAKKMMLLK